MSTVFGLILVAVLAAISAFVYIVVVNALDKRLAPRRRRQAVVREHQLAELRMQRAMQDTVQQLFEAARTQR